ncbi:MAG TPA: lysophospholipid acyltransferase family protein [Jatrophihabitans sp.]|jgi:1-acyl-sn-glycerol-3-phosphate acyltransferase
MAEIERSQRVRARPGRQQADAAFAAVRRYGPTMAERVEGSSRLDSRQRWARGLCRAMGRIEIAGLEHIPSTGPVLLAVNHQSFMDGALLIGFVGRVVSCVVKLEAFIPVGGRVGRVLVEGAQIPVLRGEVDPAPVRLSLDILRAGGVLGVFPEGSRGDGQVRLIRPGVGYFALKTGATVVPVAIHGSAAVTHRAGVRRPTVRMVVGEPMAFDRMTELPLPRAQWRATAETIRVALADLVADSATRHSAREAA